MILFKMDVNDLDTHPEMLNACLRELHHIDVALVAHGTLPDQTKCENDVGVLLDTFATNAVSTIMLLSVIANHLEIQCSGTLAVISSVAGDRGRQSNYVYGAAKAAVSTFCEGLRARLYKVGVHVVTIKPGFVSTPMTAGLDLPKKLTVSPERAGQAIRRAIERKMNVVYVPGFWWWIMLIIRSMPHDILKRTRL
ncbi:short-chain dehydrogenase [Halopseudomonas salina]|uniref:Short-chain dehydrogenase n=1 Tax=Halopseudomonas salina TaxID=1323744 RepID=A0ABQ1PV42_9GAMM|nr:short-chain dehydrogenase [Halopseudomonas salina]